MAAAPSPQRIQTPKTFFYLLPISLLSLSARHNLCCISPLYSVLPIKCFKSLRFSSQHVSELASDVAEDEETAVGDCIVFEEGIFDDPFLQNAGNFTNGDTQLGTLKNTELEPENLVRSNWNTVGRWRREGKPSGLLIRMPMRSLRAKLQQLKPVVLDNPEPGYFRDHNEQKGDDRRSEEEVTTSRVSTKNPRLAVYGKGLDDISELFDSESYDPANSKKSEGTRKLFSKEEKLLLNKRVPNMAIATSDGLTGIHKAILGKKQAIFNFLFRESVNPFIRDKQGKEGLSSSYPNFL